MPKLSSIASAVGRKAVGGIVRASRPIIQATTFTVDAARAHHRLLGKHTVPEIDEDAPKAKELNRFGQAALIVVPVLPAMWLTSVTATPLLVHGAKATFKTSKKVANVALLDLKQEDRFDTTEPTLNVKEHLYGIPGHLLGASLGGMGVGLILSGRGLTNTASMTNRSFRAVVHKALPDLVDKDDSKHTVVSNILGAPGYVIGATTGGAFLAAYATKPILSNSLKSFAGVQKLTTNSVLTAYDETIFSDDRSKTQKYGLGSPGIAIGAGVAPVVFSLACFGRTAKENKRSFTDGVDNWEPDDMGSTEDDDDTYKRSVLLKYGLGSLGYVSGNMVGFAMNKGVFENSVVNLVDYSAKAIRPVLSEHKPDLDEDSRSNVEKYVAGLPGTLLAPIPIGIFYTFWITGNTIQSWRAASGSMMNGATNLRIFNGIANDHRMKKNKALGGLGYATAMATTLPLASGVFAVWTVTHGALILTSVAISPAVAAYKGGKKLGGEKRFEPDELPEFQDIYSLLNGDGSITEGATVEHGQSGNETAASFVRHSLTMNDPSLTEDVLDCILTAYRQSDNPETFFESNAFEVAIQTAKRHHRFETNDQCIKDIADFVKKTMAHQVDAVPDNLYANEQSWWKTMKGHDKKAQPQPMHYPSETATATV